MSRTGTAVKAEILTFRIDASLKREVSRIARTERKPVGELLRELVQEHVKQVRRREFEVEAGRQSRLLAAAALDPNGDEAAVMRELEAHFEEVTREWK